MSSGAYFDRFDICEAFYCYASDWHAGQWSEDYKIFGRLHNLQFRPSPMISSDNLSENAQVIYEHLVATRQGECDDGQVPRL